MNEHELRAMVRESIARHAGPSSGSAPAGAMPLTDPASPLRAHASHARLPLMTGGDEDGACLIEPAVRCTHCGFCQSYGH
jgi:hypothetical protein